MQKKHIKLINKFKIVGVLIILPVFAFISQVFAANQMTTDSYSFTIVPDTTAPSAIANLAVSSISQNSVTLSWTAPGDDGSSGTAASYDVRYSTATINASNWASATQATGEPTPSSAGSSESISISGLSSETTYYFAIRATDEAANTASISNIATDTTPDETAPAAVSNISVSSISQNSATLSWTAPGDDGSSGTAASYDVRYSTATINASNWASATQATGEPTPSAAGATESLIISSLSAETTYYFAIKVKDEVGNESNLSNVANDTTDAIPDTTPPYTDGHIPAKSATGVSTDSNIIVHVKDDGAGVDVDSIEMLVNGVSVSPVITGSPADYTLTYNPSADFITGQSVFVTINAMDLAP